MHIYHFKSVVGEHHFYARAKSKERAIELISLSCGSHNSSVGKAWKETSKIPCNILNDSLGYLIDRKLGNKKEIFFCDIDQIRLYVTEGFEPKEKKSIFELLKE